MRCFGLGGATLAAMHKGRDLEMLAQITPALQVWRCSGQVGPDASPDATLGSGYVAV